MVVACVAILSVDANNLLMLDKFMALYLISIEQYLFLKQLLYTHPNSNAINQSSAHSPHTVQ